MMVSPVAMSASSTPSARPLKTCDINRLMLGMPAPLIACWIECDSGSHRLQKMPCDPARNCTREPPGPAYAAAVLRYADRKTCPGHGGGQPGRVLRRSPFEVI